MSEIKSIQNEPKLSQAANKSTKRTVVKEGRKYIIINNGQLGLTSDKKLASSVDDIAGYIKRNEKLTTMELYKMLHLLKNSKDAGQGKISSVVSRIIGSNAKKVHDLSQDITKKIADNFKHEVFKLNYQGGPNASKLEDFGKLYSRYEHANGKERIALGADMRKMADELRKDKKLMSDLKEMQNVFVKVDDKDPPEIKKAKEEIKSKFHLRIKMLTTLVGRVEISEHSELAIMDKADKSSGPIEKVPVETNQLNAVKTEIAKRTTKKGKNIIDIPYLVKGFGQILTNLLGAYNNEEKRNIKLLQGLLHDEMNNTENRTADQIKTRLLDKIEKGMPMLINYSDFLDMTSVDDRLEDLKVDLRDSAINKEQFEKGQMALVKLAELRKNPRPNEQDLLDVKFALPMDIQQAPEYEQMAAQWSKNPDEDVSVTLKLVANKDVKAFKKAVNKIIEDNSALINTVLSERNI